MTSSTNTENQSGGSPLPEPRGKNGISNATEGELKGDIEWYETWGGRAGWAVAIAVLIEVPLILWPPANHLLETLTEAAATLVIGLGVAGEVVFHKRASIRQGELLRRSEDRLGEMEVAAAFANETAATASKRAAEAELELAELEARLAPRKLVQAGQERIAKRLAAVPGIKGQIGSSPPEFESMRLEMAIHAALSMGGWTLTRGVPTHTSMGGGVTVFTSSDFPTVKAGGVLAEALIEEGIYTLLMPSDLPAGEVFVVVGSKPPTGDLVEAQDIVNRINEMVKNPVSPATWA